jgi:hypothetical protein
MSIFGLILEVIIDFCRDIPQSLQTDADVLSPSSPKSTVTVSLLSSFLQNTLAFSKVS